MDGEDEATCPSCSLIVKVIYDKVTYSCYVLINNYILNLISFLSLQEEYMQSEEVSYVPPTKEATTA